MSGELKAYYRAIDKKMLNCSKQKRRKILSIHRGNIEAYFEENPDATIKDIEAYFGSPEKIAESFLQSSEYQETEKKFSINRNVIRIFLIVAIAILIVFSILGTIYIYDGYRYSHGSFTDSSVHEGVVSIPSDALETY